MVSDYQCVMVCGVAPSGKTAGCMSLLNRIDVYEKTVRVLQLAQPIIKRNIMIITIARQCGCRALNVGEILARHYGIPLYTRKSLMAKAKEMGILDEMTSFFDERPVDELMSAISEFPFERTAVREKFRSAFMKMIGNEDCIIIGRCGNFIFSDREDLVTIFLHGKLSDRIVNAAEEENLSLAEAEDFVHTTDDCRVAYHSFYTGLSWGYAPEYDICIDTCRLGTEKTAAIIENYISNL